MGSAEKRGGAQTPLHHLVFLLLSVLEREREDRGGGRRGLGGAGAAKVAGEE